MSNLLKYHVKKPTHLGLKGANNVLSFIETMPEEYLYESFLFFGYLLNNLITFLKKIELIKNT